MRRFIATGLLASAAAVAGCGHSRGEDGGPTMARDYPVGSFSAIEVAGPYDVEIRTGPAAHVEARGPEKLLDHTQVEVRGDKLVIRPEGKTTGLHFGWHRSKAKFVVTVPQLSAATIAGSGGIKIDRISGDAFAGTIEGSGGLELGALDVKSLKLAIGGSGGVKAGAGKASSAEYEIAGSGGIDAGGISAEHAKVSIAGSGSVRANATGTADVDIMGSGNANVSGGAKCSVSKSGSGNVRCG